MKRSVLVCTCSNGCEKVSMLSAARAADADSLAKVAADRLAKGRQQVNRTNVADYVERKSPALAKKITKFMRKKSREVARKAASLYEKKFSKAEDSPSKKIDDLLKDLNLDSVGEEISGQLTSPMLEAFRKAAKLGVYQVGVELDHDAFKQVDQKALDYADKRGAELIEDLADTTIEDMRSLLTRAVAEGMSAAELADEIEDMGAFGEARSMMIARTELAMAHVQGNIEGWRATGEVVGKRWLLADTHPEPDECDEAAEAGEVGLDDEFVDGIDAPPAHPNCLCDVVPVLREDEGES